MRSRKMGKLRGMRVGTRWALPVWCHELDRTCGRRLRLLDDMLAPWKARGRDRIHGSRLLDGSMLLTIRLEGCGPSSRSRWLRTCLRSRVLRTCLRLRTRLGSVAGRRIRAGRHCGFLRRVKARGFACRCFRIPPSVEMLVAVFLFVRGGGRAGCGLW